MELACLLSALALGGPGVDPSWVEAMREVHGRFKGEKGTFAQFGDSITVTMAFWAPLVHSRRNAPPEVERAFARVKGYMKDECWRGWKGAAHGSEGGMTIRWAHQHIDEWLRKLNPEAALIMYGTNDLSSLEREEYGAKTREVVKRCLENGTVAILTTIPPRSGFAEKSRVFAEETRAIARDLKVPLIDYQAEVLRRRRDDWDGSRKEFKEHEGYDVPTLISRDGVHPSFPKKHQDDYSEEGLSRSGYTLRSYLTLLAYAEVIEKALERKP